MKNKKLSWILLPVVLGIWGMIGWKVYASMNSEKAGFSSELPQTASFDTSKVPEKYQLNINYRDPFLDLPVANNSSVASKHYPDAAKKADQVKEPPPTIVPPTIQYYGLVKETTSNKTVGFLRVNGETHFVKQNDVVHGIQVEKMWADSVALRIDSKRLVILK